MLIMCVQSWFGSRASIAVAAAATVGSIGWYTHLYGTLPFIGEVSANMEDEGLHPPNYPWPHNGWFDSFDHARFVLLVILHSGKFRY